MKSNRILVIWFLAVILMFSGIAFSMYRIKIINDNSVSVAGDYNGEMDALIEKEKDCYGLKNINNLLEKFEDFDDRFEKLNYAEKDAINNNLYKEYLESKEHLNKKISMIEDAKNNPENIEGILYGFDEDFDIEEHLEEIEALIEEYYNLPEDSRYTLECYGRFLEIEDKYNRYRANIVIELINELGDVSDTEEFKDKLDRANEAYNALNYKAKYKVSNHDDLLNKSVEYYDMIIKKNS